MGTREGKPLDWCGFQSVPNLFSRFACSFWPHIVVYAKNKGQYCQLEKQTKKIITISELQLLILLLYYNFVYFITYFLLILNLWFKVPGHNLPTARLKSVILPPSEFSTPCFFLLLPPLTAAASFLPPLAICCLLGLTSWPHPLALFRSSRALMAQKNMHFSFWNHEIFTHLCNVLLTHADVSVLTGHKGRGKGGEKDGGGCMVPKSGLKGADLTLSQSVTSWFIYCCMNMLKHLG